MDWMSVGLWLLAALGVFVVLVVLFVALFFRGYVLGDGDCVFWCDIVGLLLTILLFPPLLLVGGPLCWIWPVHSDEPRGDVVRARWVRMFFWWRWVFSVWNGERNAEPMCRDRRG